MEAEGSGQFAENKIGMTFEKSKEIARSVQCELIMYRDLLRDERTPASAKLFLGLARIQTTLGKTIRLLWNPEQDYFFPTPDEVIFRMKYLPDFLKPHFSRTRVDGLNSANV